MATMFELGEKAFLKALLPTLTVDPSFVNGFGHDASIVDVGLGEDLAFKIDRAPFPVAVRHGIGDFRTWGRLAVAANVSDLLAVGAKPHALMLSLVVPGGFDAADASAIVMGCEEACASHGIAFIGGDTKEGQTAQVIGAALGTVEKGAAFGRAPAMPGDYLFLAGRVGAFAGTLALIDDGPFEGDIPPEWVSALVAPNARVHEGRYMRESRKVAAACDLSDGLADALNIFCAAGAGITLSESRLPMHPLAVHASAKCGVPLWRFAFGVGDWAIAFVVRDKDADAFRAAGDSRLDLFEIGRFDDTGLKLIRDGTCTDHEVPNLINEQFRRRIEDSGTYLHDLLHAP
jgi:thiamine-monophosphate kinase